MTGYHNRKLLQDASRRCRTACAQPHSSQAPSRPSGHATGATASSASATGTATAPVTPMSKAFFTPAP